MENNRHSRAKAKRKHSHSHHQSMKQSTHDKSASQEVTPVFGKVIERGSNELQKFAQNVLGRYSDFPMDKSEQMYGVADPTQGSKPLQSRETSSRTGHSAQSLSNLDLKKDKVRKKHKLIGVGEKVNRSIQPIEIREASVQPFSSHSHVSSLLEKNADSANQLVASSRSKSSLASQASSISTSASHSIAQQISNSDTTLSSMTKGRKKVKRRKRRSSPIENEFDIQSESVESSKPQPEVPESVEPRLEVPESVESSKPRPEALHIHVTADNCGQNDAPDTGDVRHMLQELLYPPPVSLVTPIPTPNKVQPFIFPTQFSHYIFKTPIPSELNSSTPHHHNPSGTESDMNIQHKNHSTWVNTSSSSSSCSSSSSSSGSNSSGSSSHSSCSSREQSPVDLFSEDEVDQQVKDEGTRFTLEKLQQIVSSNTAAITPLKKTPPFVIPAEELANLSPAKPCKSAALIHSDLTLTSQASLGFHPLDLRTNNAMDDSYSQSDSSYDSESDTEVIKSKSHLCVPLGRTLQSLGETDGYHVDVSQEQRHLAADELPPDVKYCRKKRKSTQSDLPVVKRKKQPGNIKLSDSSWTNLIKTEGPASRTSQIIGTGVKSQVTSSSEGQPNVLSSLLVRIPLADLRISESAQQQLEKPKATVEPIVRNPIASNRRNTADMTEAEEVQGRDRYSRMPDEYSAGPVHDYPVERSTGHAGVRWMRDPRYGHGSEYGRGHGWEREHYRVNAGGGEEYWSDHRRSYRHPPERKSDPEYFMQEARHRKKEADKIMVPGLEKAKLYMESVTYFMRHGGAIEHEQQGATASQAIKRNPYKMYSDTVNMIKYCQNMAGECKPLLVLCLRCQSALYWRMFLIKQPSTAAIHKELQEFFIPPKGSQSKSPFLGGLSPLPSPASVGSTASTSSGGGGPSHSTDFTGSSVTLPRHIFNKAAEHLVISTLINTCLELWRLSDSYMEQCREFFLNADRKPSLTIHYYSPVFHVASWVEDILKSFSWT